MKDKTMNSLVWLVLFLAMFVFVAKADSKQRDIYWEWYTNGGATVEAERARQEKVRQIALVEYQRKQRVYNALQANKQLNELTVVLYEAIRLREELLARNTLTLDELRGVEHLDKSIKESGRQIASLAKKIQSNTK